MDPDAGAVADVVAVAEEDSLADADVVAIDTPW
jgi:hypothetical protein